MSYLRWYWYNNVWYADGTEIKRFDSEIIHISKNNKHFPFDKRILFEISKSLSYCGKQ